MRLKQKLACRLTSTCLGTRSNSSRASPARSCLKRAWRKDHSAHRFRMIVPATDACVGPGPPFPPSWSLGCELMLLREQGAFASVGYRVLTIGRLSMGMLMLRCPMTDRNFSTGIYAEKSRFKSMLDTERVVLCLQCGREHTWRPRDAWLVECVNGHVSIACDNPKLSPVVAASSPPAPGPEVLGICRIEEDAHSVVSPVRG
jgi:hypothetical protein